MKELPILFSTPMVQALLDGRKTMTRRVCKHQHWSYSELINFNVNKKHKSIDKNVSSKYNIGDLLWVRETFYPLFNGSTAGGSMYKANYTSEELDKFKLRKLKWKPSIFMPLKHARIWLKVTDVRVERLSHITEEDAIREGIQTFNDLDGFVHYSPNLFYTKEQLKDGYPYVSTAQYSFMTLWMSINGKDSYHINPAVFVYSFEVLSTNGKPINI